MRAKRQRKKYNQEWAKRNKRKVYQWHKKYREENRVKINKRKKKYKVKSRVYCKKYRINHAEYLKKKKQKYNRRMKEILVAGYGGKCECCGETNLEFLALDHRYGDGAEDRRKNKLRGASLHKYVIDLGFPKRYRILCHNCNMSLGFYGYCPHKRRKKWIVKK